jgi:predicted acyltransferase
VSTLPAIATTLFGIIAGHLLRLPVTPAVRTAWLFLGGNVLIGAGQIWSVWMPINKNLWTGSYALFMAGLATIVFGICYWLVDIQGWQRVTRPLAIYGMNAIAVYVLAGAIARLLGVFELKQPLYNTVFAPLSSDPRVASLCYAIAYVLMLYAISYAMYRRGWFLRF